MQDFWLCESCKSMNRGQADRCYRCHAPKVQATLATVHERPKDAVIPGVDVLDAGRAAALVTQHSYVDVSLLGYLCAALFIVPVAAGLVATCAAVVAILAVMAPEAFHRSDSLARLLLLAGGVWAGGLFLAIVCHSVFLGITARNVPALGGGNPRLGPVRASLWWLEALLWVIWAEFVVWFVPVFVLLLVGLVVSLVMAMVGWLMGSIALMIATVYFIRHEELHFNPNPFAYATRALRRPAVMLDDLSVRLAAQSSPRRGLVSLWSTSWTSAMLIHILAPYLIVLVYLLAFLTLIFRAVSGVGYAQLLTGAAEMDVAVWMFALLLELFALVIDMLGFLLMARITVSLVRAQRERRRWLLRGAGPEPNRLSSSQVPALAAEPGSELVGAPSAVQQGAQPPGPPGAALPGVAPTPAPPPGYVQPGPAIARSAGSVIGFVPRSVRDAAPGSAPGLGGPSAPNAPAAPVDRAPGPPSPRPDDPTG